MNKNNNKYKKKPTKTNTSTNYTNLTNTNTNLTNTNTNLTNTTNTTNTNTNLTNTINIHSNISLTINKQYNTKDEDYFFFLENSMKDTKNNTYLTKPKAHKKTLSETTMQNTTIEYLNSLSKTISWKSLSLQEAFV